MKARKMLAICLAAMMTVASVVSTSAAELTETAPLGRTEVTAQIEGAAPGDVSYIITIPDVVDFGTLTQPADDSVDSYKDVEYTVTATEITGLDADEQQISVYVRDQNATVDGDQEFWITHKTDSSKKFTYDIFDVAGEEMNVDSVNINRNTMTSASGYYLAGFDTQGESLTGTLRINQVQLCDYNLADIVGEYSGYMVFFSAVEDK